MNDIGKEILEQYDLEIYKVKKGRGAFICETNQGIKLLKEYEGTMKHLELENEIVTYLKNSWDVKVDSYVRNKEGSLYTTGYINSGGYKYYKEPSNYVLKDWFIGRECNLESENDVLLAVSVLGMMHKKLRFKGGLEGKIKVLDKEILLLEEFEKHNRELRRTRNFIRDKKKKNEFELCIINTYSNMYEQAMKATNILENSNYQKLYFDAVSQGHLCHGSYNQHNILMLETEIAITNFHKFTVQIQIYDLYQFMRKVLEKNNWNEKLGAHMIEEYNKQLPISNEEMKVLYAMFCYPEKYWKQINYYYNNNKCWIPQRNMEKLLKAANQYEQKNKFLEICFS